MYRHRLLDFSRETFHNGVEKSSGRDSARFLAFSSPFCGKMTAFVWPKRKIISRDCENRSIGMKSVGKDPLKRCRIPAARVRHCSGGLESAAEYKSIVNAIDGSRRDALLEIPSLNFD